jgi:hypothetical protein
VLYTVKMAFARGGAMPPSLTGMLAEMEAELDFAGEMFLQGNGPRVINKDAELRGWGRRGQDLKTSFSADWWWAP